MHIIRPYMLVNVGCVMLGRIIAQTLLSGLMIKCKVFLHFTIQAPKILQFHGAGALLFDGVIADTNSGSAFNMYRHWWLWMSKFSKSKVKDFGFLGIYKKGT